MTYNIIDVFAGILWSKGSSKKNQLYMGKATYQVGGGSDVLIAIIFQYFQDFDVNNNLYDVTRKYVRGQLKAAHIEHN